MWTITLESVFMFVSSMVVFVHIALAPFSYLILYCLIVNESSGPKRVTHHIFYSAQKIAVVQKKKES